MNFDAFWKAYPKRHRPAANPRQAAFKAWEKVIRKGADPAHIVSAAYQYADECRDDGKYGTEFVAMASTWLNQERFADYEMAEIEVPQTVERMRFKLVPSSPEAASWGRIQSNFGMMWTAVKKRANVVVNQAVIEVETDRLDLPRWQKACYNSGYVLVVDIQTAEGANVAFAPSAVAL